MEEIDEESELTGSRYGNDRERLVLNLGHNPLYRHFCERLYVELLKNYLFINYWLVANPILPGRRLKKSLQPLKMLTKNFPR